MADNISESKHIASLDFDISKIDAQLKSIEDKIRASGTSIKELVKNNWQIPTQQEQTVKVLLQERATLKSICTLYEQSAKIQKNIRDIKISENAIFSSQAASIREKSEEIFKQYQATGKITDEMREQTAILQEQLQLIQTQTRVNAFDNPVVNNRSMLSEVASKAKWYIAGSAAFAGGYVAKQTIQTLSEVEYKVMEITRVMNDSTLDIQKFQQELFSLAVEYGRSFDDVSEVALRFAQAGYNVNETLSMTKDSLLALNTAELDVQNSTQSMIGIMQQWGYTASELVTIIDKVNYTADNNAITSQDLVDGLLRSSSAARSAKFSFEETLGAITALKEASGRTGREVGNALNSIINYVQRAKSLSTFEGLGIKVYTDESRQNLVPFVDMIGQLSEKVKLSGESVINTLMKQTELTELYSQELAIASGAEEEYTKAIIAETAASRDSLSDIEKKTALETAGMHRRNYFIALLNNFNEIQKVTNSLQNAEGYSMQENSKHMDTLRTKYTQLIAALQALAVESGEGGFTTLAKGALDLATALTEGLNNGFVTLPILIGAATLAISLCRKEIKLLGIDGATSFAKLKEQAQAADKSVLAYTASTICAKLKTAALQAAISAGLTLAIQALITVIYEVVNAAEKSRQKALQAAQAYAQQGESLQKLKSDYISIAGSMTAEKEKTAALKTLQEQLASQYGIVRGELDLLNLSREEAIKKIDEETKALANKTIAELGSNYSKAKNAIENVKGNQVEDISPYEDKHYVGMAEMLKEYGLIVNESKGLFGAFMYSFTPTGSNLVEQQKQLESLLALLRAKKEANQISADENTLMLLLQSLYNKNAKVLEQHLDIYNQGNVAYKVLNEALKQQTSSLGENSSEIAQNTQKYNALTTALGVLSNGNALNYSQLLELIGLYPQLADKVQMVGDGYTIETQALANLINERKKDDIQTYRKNNADLNFVLNELGLTTITAANAEAARALVMAKVNELTRAGVSDTDEMVVKLKEFADTLGQFVKIDATPKGGSGGYSGASKSWSEKQVEAFKYLNHMGQYTLQQQIDFYRQLSQAAYVSAQERKNYETKVFDLTKQLLNEQVRSAEEAKNREIKRVQEEAQAEIDALRRVQDERKRDRDKEDYDAKRQELLTDKSYWEQRTGKEATEKLIEIDKKIAELDKDWQRKQEDWNVDDRIKAIERARDAEIESIEKAWKRYVDRFSEANINVMAQAAVFTPQLYQQYLAGYINPMHANTIKGFDGANQQMIASAGTYATQIYNQFDKNFISQMKNQLDYIFNRIGRAEDRISSLRTSSYNPFPYSHTGSKVARDGAVNVEAGEIIIRKDLAAGLEKMLTPYMGNGDSIVTNNRNETRNDNGKVIMINKGGSLFNVENQEISSDVDADIVARKVVLNLGRELSNIF